MRLLLLHPPAVTLAFRALCSLFGVRTGKELGERGDGRGLGLPPASPGDLRSHSAAGSKEQTWKKKKR